MRARGGVQRTRTARAMMMTTNPIANRQSTTSRRRLPGSSADRRKFRGLEAGRADRRGRGGARPLLTAVMLFLGLLAALPLEAQSPDRSKPPPVGPAPDLELPPVERLTLSNGLEVLVMEKRGLPLVQVNLHVRAGSVREEAGRLGLADLTADMLDEGAAGLDALALADRFERLGARFGIGTDAHLSTVSLRVPVARLDEALGLIADVVLRPNFPEAELERLKRERLTAMIRRHDEPGRIAGALFDRTLFGEAHPYGRLADEASLRAITTADVRDFHARYYRPGNATLIVVGDIDAAGARAALERAFGGWTGGAVEQEKVAPAGQVEGRVVYLVDKPGSAQSVILIGRIGIARHSGDYYPVLVMNTILGGSFTSRLNQNLREDKGYTYGASSTFDARPVPGAFVAAASVQTDATGPALREFMKELRGIREGVTDDEVQRARNYLAMRFPAGFQSVAGIAQQLADVVQFGLPADDFNHFTDRVLAVTRQDVERVARKYIDPENLVIVVVGDRARIEAQVRAEELGEIRFLEVTDVFGEPPAATED